MNECESHQFHAKDNYFFVEVNGKVSRVIWSVRIFLKIYDELLTDMIESLCLPSLDISLPISQSRVARVEGSQHFYEYPPNVILPPCSLETVTTVHFRLREREETVTDPEPDSD